MNYAGLWHPLQVDKAVQAEVMERYEITEDMEFEGHFLHRQDFPVLARWLERNSYLQEEVLVNHYPEVMDKD